MKKLCILILLLLLVTPVVGQVENVAVVKEIPPPSKVIPFSLKNVTKLIIEPSFKSVRLKAGESTSFTIKIKNPTEKDVTVKPWVFVSPYSKFVMDESWVSFDKKTFTLKPGEEAELKVTVKVPKDAEKGFYSCTIVLTNDTFPTPYPSEIPKFVNAFHLSVNVWIPPSVRITPKYVSDYVEAGSRYEFTITVENTADRSFTLNPKVGEQEFYPLEYTPLSDKIVRIEAPSTIPPHSKVKVRVTVDVPEDAKVISGYIDLGINDPGLEKWNQRVNVHLSVYQIPKEPFVKAVSVQNASELKIEVSTNPTLFIIPIFPAFGKPKQNADVIVKIYSPSGIFKVRPKITEVLAVTTGGIAPPWERTEGIYKVVGYSKTYTYVIKYPESGIWRIEVIPKNCFGFGLKIEVN